MQQLESAEPTSGTRQYTAPVYVTRYQRLRNIICIIGCIAGSVAAVLVFACVSYVVGSINRHSMCVCDDADTANAMAACQQPPLCNESTLVIGLIYTGTTLLGLAISASIYTFYFWTYAVATLSSTARRDIEVGEVRDATEQEYVFVMGGPQPFARSVASKRDVVRLRTVFVLSYVVGASLVVAGCFATAAAWLALAPILLNLADVYMTPEAKKPDYMIK